MSKEVRSRFTTEFKEQAVARLLVPGATQAGVAKELGVTSSQLKGWRLELEATGSAEAIRRQKVEAAELAELRRENRRLKEEVEVMRKASAFSRSERRNNEGEARLHRRPCRGARRPADVPASFG